MAIGALVKAREWVTWFQANVTRRVGARAGWERFLVDAVMLAHEASVRDARRHRGPQALQLDHRGFSDDEFHDPVVVASRDWAWFHRHRVEVERDAPPWARFLFEALSGVFSTRVRLAVELRQALNKGIVAVNVNPHRRRRNDFTGEEEE